MEELTCPYCGTDTEYDVYEMTSEEAEYEQCIWCEKTFKVSKIEHVSYYTEEVEFGTCQKCEKEDVEIEDFVDPIFERYGEIKGCCEGCMGEELGARMRVKSERNNEAVEV
jgi:hypothetical protein